MELRGRGGGGVAREAFQGQGGSLRGWDHCCGGALKTGNRPHLERISYKLQNPSRGSMQTDATNGRMLRSRLVGDRFDRVDHKIKGTKASKSERMYSG